MNVMKEMYLLQPKFSVLELINANNLDCRGV